VIRDKALNTSVVFTDFAEFAAEVEDVLGAHADVVQIAAVGRYVVASNTVEAQLASVIVE
jgi:hypothetical protein